MTDATEPRSEAIAAEDWPPPTPPIPPFETGPTPDQGAEGDRLTAVSWSLGSAAWLIVAMFGLTVVAAVLAGWARHADLGPTALTLVVGTGLCGAYALLVLIVSRLAKRRGVPFAEAVGLRSARPAVIAGGAVLATLVGRFAAGAWGAVLQYFGMNLSGQDIDPSQLFPPGGAGVAMTFLVAVVLAPFAEEVVFRGVLLSALDIRFGSAIAIGVSSALFAVLHMTLYVIPPVFVLAVVLGWLFVKTKSLTVCVVAHATFNGTGLLLLYALHSAGVL